MATDNRLDLETRGSCPTLLENLPGELATAKKELNRRSTVVLPGCRTLRIWRKAVNP